MNYIRQEYILTTIANDSIVEKDDIYNILCNLSKDQMFFSIVTNLGDGVYNNKLVTYGKVRIANVNKDECSLIVFAPTSKLRLTIKNSSIYEIRVITDKVYLLKTKIGLDRFDLIDLPEGTPDNVESKG